LIRKVGEAIGSETRAYGIGLCLSPVLGVARDPRFATKSYELFLKYITTDGGEHKKHMVKTLISTVELALL